MVLSHYAGSRVAVTRLNAYWHHVAASDVLRIVYYFYMCIFKERKSLSLAAKCTICVLAWLVDKPLQDNLLLLGLSYCHECRPLTDPFVSV